MFDDDELGRILRSANPVPDAPRRPLSAADTAIRDRIMTLPVPRRKAWRLGRIAAGGVLTIALVSGGSMAIAGNGLETPWGWVADNLFHLSGTSGQDCINGFRIESDGPAENSALMQDAREIMRSIDIASLDTSAAEIEVRKENAAAISPDGKPSPVVQSDAQVKQTAIGRIISDTLWSSLKAKGYGEDDVLQIHLSGQSTDCR